MDRLLQPATRVGRALLGPLLARRRRARQRRSWEARWGSAGFRAPWMGRGVSPEIVAAVEQGWFAAGAPALDLGCGEGEVAAWLASRGFPALGVDIAPSAIARYRRLHGEAPGRLAFAVADLCAAPPPGRGFMVLVDRGCLHQIAPSDVGRYVRHLAAASRPGARLLLFMKAFRGPGEGGDAPERLRLTEGVERAFRGRFALERSAETHLDPCGGRDPARAMRGMAFWLERV